MHRGDYVEHRKLRQRGELMDLMPDGHWLIYSPHLGPLNEMWWARDDELTVLLTAKEING